MGRLIQGQWLTDDKLAELEAKAYQASGGKFERGTAGFRNWITADGSAGPSGTGGFKAEAGRYHLFAALNCPWAHRTLIYRQVKKLQAVVSLSLVAPLRTDQGWVFDRNQPRFRDELYQLNAMYELYLKANPEYSGRVTVPVLWDKQQQTIVSNESSEIIRMFNQAFNHVTGDTQDFYPQALAQEIDELNGYIFHHINNGVYKAGFARTQAAYDEAVTGLFTALEVLELRLARQSYLLGEEITEADWRLLPTLVRFDVGYFSAFKCNLKMLRDYPNLSRYLKALYRVPGVAQTVDLDIYRAGYHSKSPLRNPHGIVPAGPVPALY
ncbi:glutathione S-transferase family protein [Thalassomonas viridans]|uniref:Glutathione S-transferase family protein n=1 Tax=Thalassomonas viridans TaxID=137584 RepID=A0AAE9Z7D6_9GAMM|nr:glutathione S-transferase family protein [Thalassomonas viridans]WDE07400.1 glutathione S-transferase family protein [Thalassomonas viridans]